MSRIISFIAILVLALFLFFLIFFWLLPHLRPSPTIPREEMKKEELTLTLSLPEDNQVTDIAFTKVAGKTNPDALIAIYSADNEEVMEASENGSFSTDFSLKEGLNEITVISQTKDGEEKIMTRDIYYSKEGL